MPESERTALYRHFDANGDVLYIGISKDPDERWMAHRGNQEPWIHLAVRRTDEWYDSRPLALKAEEAAIKAERPPFNGKHNYDDVTFDPASWSRVQGPTKIASVADLMRAEITSQRWPEGYRIPPLKTLAGAAGVSLSIASKASGLLQREGRIRFDSGHGLFVTRPCRPGLKLSHDWFHQFDFPG
ncbi:GntR family transcriptional regulator [Streptomyces sp. NPDC101175]|uniref:GntR family transcriptional regulator n=1 Tax=Streptomyces sp. NPDC101175 TaxID=3366123 RepID=UPI003839B2A8